MRARLFVAVGLGVLFGVATSIANSVSSPFGLGADVGAGVREVARVVSLVLGPVYAWVLLPLPLGWLVAGPSSAGTTGRRTARGAAGAAGAAGGALGVVAAVLAYYVSDALVATGLPLDLAPDLPDLVLWTVVGAPGGALLGGLAGAVRRSSRG